MTADHHETESEWISITHFFEEYFPVMIFGFFFSLMLFVPMMFLEAKDKMWFFVALPTYLLIILGLLTVPAFTGKKS